MPRAQDNTGRMLSAGVFAWLLPGAGHYILGHRGLAAVFFLGVTAPYAFGLAIGGIKNSINPWSNHWLFLAELGVGSYTTVGLLANRAMTDLPAQLVPHVLAEDHEFQRFSPPDREALRAKLADYVSFFPESEVSQIYLAAAGLLNLLAILDVLMRAQTGGLPTYHRELHEESPSAGSAPS